MLYFLQCFHIIVRIGENQTPGDVVVEIIQVLCQLAAAGEVQGALETDHDAAGTGNGLAFFLDLAVGQVALRLRHAVHQAVKQHLDKGHVIGHRSLGSQVVGAVRLHRFKVNSHN